jgi:hypothetical protein
MMVRGVVSGVALSVACVLAGAPAQAADAMPAAEQDRLVKQHCAVCHSDAAGNGGLSLEHFDAARVPPSLAAVMLSKLAGGLSLETIQAAPSHLPSKARVMTAISSGAINAAGIAPPASDATYALVDALALAGRGAQQWHVGPEGNAPADRKTVTASILRQVARPEDGQAAMYRLILACDPASKTGEIRLSWSPLPTEATLLAVVDGRAPVAIVVQGREKMGNGTPTPITPPASAVLYDSRRLGQGPSITLPDRTLAITGLFGDRVEFPFDTLPRAARRTLTTCLAP